MNSRGMTLLEVMMAVAIMTIVMGTLFTISISLTDTARLQEIKVNTNDEARRALLGLVPELRQAGESSINWAALPGQVLTFQPAADLDGNGVAVDVNGALELGPVRTVQRDLEDSNGDGLTTTQLVMVTGDTVRVLANALAPENESLGDDNVLDPEEDVNGNGRLDRGFWAAPRDNGLEITVQTQGETRRGMLLSTTLSEFILPRN